MKEDRILVDVLLATYNGEKYLNSLLDSLVKQKGVDIHLIVGDDGSTDQTIAIINSYSKCFQSLSLYKSNRIGPSENFLRLLSYSKNKFIAFCDQDDVWDEFHLVNSVSRLQETANTICLTYSRVTEFNVETDSFEIWPNFDKSHLLQILVENPARGCTMVFSEDLRDLVKNHLPSNAVMHDWWILIIAWTCGDVIFEKKPEVWYRLHDSNHIGKGKKGPRHTLQSFKLGYWPPLNQAKEILFGFGDMMHANKKAEVEEFVASLNSNFKLRVTFLKKRKYRMRSSRLGEFKLCVGIILFPVLFRNQNRYQNHLPRK